MVTYPASSSPEYRSPLRFSAGDDSEDGAQRPLRFDRATAAREDLPYKIELWDEAKAAVEQVLAVTASGGIGFAAYYAATREHPERYITFKHKNSVVAQWNPPRSQ